MNNIPIRIFHKISFWGTFGLLLVHICWSCQDNKWQDRRLVRQRMQLIVYLVSVSLRLLELELCVSTTTKQTIYFIICFLRKICSNIFNSVEFSCWLFSEIVICTSSTSWICIRYASLDVKQPINRDTFGNCNFTKTLYIKGSRKYFKPEDSFWSLWYSTQQLNLYQTCCVLYHSGQKNSLGLSLPPPYNWNIVLKWH
jgi:hypothetical protein